jgi:hypothetical protein
VRARSVREGLERWDWWLRSGAGAEAYPTPRPKEAVQRELVSGAVLPQFAGKKGKRTKASPNAGE